MAAAALLSLGQSAMAPVSASDEMARRYTYVAHDFYVIGPDQLAQAIGAQAGVWTAPLGHVGFFAFADRFTVHIQDNGTFPTIAVWVSSGRTRAHLCLWNGSSGVVEGLVPGERVDLFVPNATQSPRSCPASGATAGTLTITP